MCPPSWVHEPKLDGYRLQVVKDGSTVRLYSRRGHDWGKRLAAVAESLRAIPTRSAILDAELCLPGRDGIPSLRFWRPSFPHVTARPTALSRFADVGLGWAGATWRRIVRHLSAT